jgi:hypothetical protein
MQCLVHEEEVCLDGVWLSKWDRRVQKAEVRLKAMKAYEDARRLGHSRNDRPEAPNAGSAWSRSSALSHGGLTGQGENKRGTSVQV